MSSTVAVRVAWPLEQTAYSAMLHFIGATMQENRTEACKRPSDQPKGSFLWHRRGSRGMANDKLQLQRTLRTAQRTALRTLRTKRKAQRTPAYAISTLINRASYVSNGPPDDDSVPLVPTAVPSDVSFVPPKIGCSCCCSTAQFSTIEKGGGFPVNASSG